MINTVPITAVQTAVYKALTKYTTGYPVIDDTTPLEDGILPADAVCIIGGITAVPQVTKNDAVIWETTITIDVYSNYRGKKVINGMVDDIVTVLSGAELECNGYDVLMRNVDIVEVRAEDFVDDHIWQHGIVRFVFRVSQTRL